MNETKIEFTIPDEDDNGDGGPDSYRSLIVIEGTGPEKSPGISQ